MTSPIFDIEIRAFDRATNVRLNFNPKLVESVSWSYVERGGAEMATVVIKVPFEDIPVANGDFLEIWAQNDGSTVPRWRGIVNVPERGLSTNEKHTITAYGRMEDMSHVVLDKIITNPATYDFSTDSLVGGADLAIYAAAIYKDYIARIGQSSASYQPWNSFTADIQPTLINLVQLDATLTTARAAMDSLADQAGTNVVWGWDIDPITGVDRFYLRPRVTSVVNQFYIGVGVEEITSPSEFQALTNAVWIKGGPAQFPNREFNSSFEAPSIPDGDWGSILNNGGFEDEVGSQWIFSTGGTAGLSSYDPGGNQFGMPHTGTWFGEINDTGGYIYQDATVADLTKTYVAALYARQGNSSFLAAAVVQILGIASDNVTVTETWPLEILIDSAHGVNSTTYVGGQPSTVEGAPSLAITGQFTNPSTAKVRFLITGTDCGSGKSILVDDCTFNVIDSVGQPGWIASVQDGDSSLDNLNSVEWGCTDQPADGAYFVRANVLSQPTHRTAIQTSPGSENGATGYRYQCVPGETIWIAALVRMRSSLNGQLSPPVTQGLAYPQFQGLGSGEVITQNNDSPPGGFIIPADDNWYFIYQPINMFANTTLGLTQIAFGGNGIYDIDAISARDQAAFPLTNTAIIANTPATGYAYGANVVAAYLQEFLRGTDFEAYLDVNNASVQSAGLTTGTNGAENSINLYGRREAIVSNKNMVALNGDAYSWAATWLNQFAVPIGRTRVKLADEQAQTPDPSTAQLMRVSGTSNDIPDQYSTKTTYTWGPSAKLGIDIELTTQRPTLAKLLLSAAQASAGSGAASATGVTAAAVASSSAGGGGSGAPSTPSTNFGTSASPNITGSGTAWTLTQTPVVGFEIIADGARLLDGTDYTYNSSTLAVTLTSAPANWIVANIS